MLFSAKLPWCCFCAEIKVLRLERNFARIFYSINKNFWSQEPPEGGTWVGTTHQGVRPLQPRPGVLSPPGGSADPETDAIKSYFSRKNEGERIIVIHEMEPPSPPVLHREVWCRLKLRRYFPKEEGMMQHSGGRYFPQIWNQGYRTSRRTQQHNVNNPCTQITNPRNPTC